MLRLTVFHVGLLTINYAGSLVVSNLAKCQGGAHYQLITLFCFFLLSYSAISRLLHSLTLCQVEKS